MRQTLFFSLLGLAVAAPFIIDLNSPIRKVLVESPVTEAVRKSGVQVITGHKTCKERQLLGIYYPAIKVMLVCLNRHQSVAEVQDTLRHEAIHVVQGCIGGEIYKPGFISGMASTKEISTLDGYPPSQIGKELEARVVARGASDADVVQLLQTYCRW